MALIGFVLSKMNLLILVIALFSIVAFFTLSLSNVILQNNAGLVLEKISKEVGISLSSSTYCDRLVVNIPPFISGFGNNKLIYKLKVSSIDDDSNAFNGNFLIFSIRDSQDEKFIISSNAIKTNAQLHVFELDVAWNEVDPEIGATFNPQAIVSTDALGIVKRVIDGKKHVFVFPCNISSTTAQACRKEIEQVLNSVESMSNFKNKGEDFACGF